MKESSDTVVTDPKRWSNPVVGGVGLGRFYICFLETLGPPTWVFSQSQRFLARYC